LHLHGGNDSSRPELMGKSNSCSQFPGGKLASLQRGHFLDCTMALTEFPNRWIAAEFIERFRALLPNLLPIDRILAAIATAVREFADLGRGSVPRQHQQRPPREPPDSRQYLFRMLQRTLPAGFIAPCLPSAAERPPIGPNWIHEIKHDGYRMMARCDGVGVRLLTRNGHDWGPRYPLIIEAMTALRVRSCLIDGEAVACDDDGLPVFDRLRYRRDNRRVFLYAFDLIELDGDDLRHEPIERRKVLLMRLLAKAPAGLQVNDHIVEPGDVVFRHACQLGFEGVVSKRLGSR
jgi:bifunctional non-homologous end joining protein LigD